MNASDPVTEGPGAARARARTGRPPKLSRERIVAAARGIDHEALTLTSVADALGVARNAVAYHVGSREDLLGLVVESELSERLATLEVPVDDWRAAIVAASEGMLAALVECGPPALAITRAPRTGFLGPSEQLLTALTRAGFADAVAGRTLAMLAEVVYAAARYTLEAAGAGERPLERDLGAVSAGAADRFPTFVRVFGESWSQQEQLRFALDLVVAGLEAQHPAAG
ncbi:TetR/AcrR family transcriptional regulator C-terminal domain-containing protein [Demequina rhizosphaerae]|uniref:TetR/AcrR family transcriptional regulator C-terminal domain-containing protein n=1 Tax=Demequina rhizosphaerae TaxID=1638985 RepID=UPI000782776D|nr:TetR/AcrR family transcriptional regulator C-terminal domain-containing protein [Demequina rhizosphaerae]